MGPKGSASNGGVAVLGPAKGPSCKQEENPARVGVATKRHEAARKDLIFLCVLCLFAAGLWASSPFG